MVFVSEVRRLMGVGLTERRAGGGISWELWVA